MDLRQKKTSFDIPASSQSKQSKWLLNFAIPTIAILCLVSRLPQLLSPDLLMDGDECIVGLMAKHFSEGKGIPFFFYGQSYGFSLIEVISIQVAYWIFGISDLAIKLSMISLWMIGIIFFYASIKKTEQLENQWTPLLIAIVFILNPAWGIWSMKARGGYITAFSLSSIITWLIIDEKVNKLRLTPWLIGVLLGVVYQSQPLWLAGLLPFTIYYLYSRMSITKTFALLAGVVIMGAVFLQIKTGVSTYWSPEVFTFSGFDLKRFYSLPELIYRSMTGCYYYSSPVEPVMTTKFLAILYIAIMMACLITALIFLIRGKNINPWFFVSCCSVLATISYMILTDGKNYRYLLPLHGFLLLMLSFLIFHFSRKKLINWILGLMILAGAISLVSFKDFSVEKKETIESIVNVLAEKNIKYLYCEGGLLQWQIMFYSNENIIARYKSKIDRYPLYVQAVDAALKNSPEEVALLGYSKSGLIFYWNPTRGLLSKRGFVLTRED